MSIEGKSVVFASDISLLENVFFKKNSEEEIIERVGIESVKIIKKLEGFSYKKIFIFCGKGNNGADGYSIGRHLLNEGFSAKIKIFQVGGTDDLSQCCKREYEKFKRVGDVEILDSEKGLKNIEIEKDVLIIDAIFGTGFSSKLEGFYLNVVDIINGSNAKIVAIDIPSGLNGNTGEVLSSAVMADFTIAVQFPKMGFFLNDGGNFIGKLFCIDVFPKEFINSVKGSKFFLINEESFLKNFLPKIVRKRDKYSRGSLFAIAGSSGMEGAAALSTLAALRTGSGIVKLFVHDAKSRSFSIASEIVQEIGISMDDLIKKCNIANAIFIGPGIGRDSVERFLDKIFEKIKKPVVVDADGLFYLSQKKEFFLKNAILTPHRKELERFFDETFLKDEDLLLKTQKFCDDNDVIIVVKGFPTYVLIPGKRGMISCRSDAGMATAGSGDVLTGVIASLLAQGVSLEMSAILGVHIHGVAGEIAAKKKNSYSMIASDIIEAIPEAFDKILD